MRSAIEAAAMHPVAKMAQEMIKSISAILLAKIINPIPSATPAKNKIEPVPYDFLPLRIFLFVCLTPHIVKAPTIKKDNIIAHRPLDIFIPPFHQFHFTIIREISQFYMFSALILTRIDAGSKSDRPSDECALSVCLGQKNRLGSKHVNVCDIC
jgi:hypothetical protein